MNKQLLDIIERFEDLTGVEHIIAMHMLFRELLEYYSNKTGLGDEFYDNCEAEEFKSEKIVPKVKRRDRILEFIIRKFEMNIFVNHERNNSIDELRIEFPYAPTEIVNWGAMTEEEMLQVYRKASRYLDDLDSIKLPVCYKENIAARESGRVEMN